MAANLPLIYGPDRRKYLRFFIISLCIALFCVISQRGKSLFHSATGSGMAAGNPVVYVSGWFFLCCSLILLAAIITSTPRLTIDGDGISNRSLFRTKSVSWEALGPFTLHRATRRGRGKRIISAWAPIVDGGKSGRKFYLLDSYAVPIETILDAVTRYHRGVPAGFSVVTESAAQPIGVPNFRFAWMTTALLCVFVGVFVLEQHFVVTPPPRSLTPSVPTLVAMGGLNWPLVRAGQWFRVFTAPFLHAGIAHLIGNAIAFLLAGYSLERLIGRAWTFLVFGAGALAGSCMSLLVSAPSVVSVGASGGIMAMLVTLFVISFRLPAGQLRARARLQSARLAVPALVPLSGGAASIHVDYGAHIGGALLGVAVGVFLLGIWRNGSPLPRFMRPALVLALVALAGFVIGGYAAAASYTTFASPLAARIPAAELPRSLAAMSSSSARLVAAYPGDPLAHFYFGETKLLQGDVRGAEQQLQVALSLAIADPLQTAPRLANTIRGSLALVLLVLLEEKRQPEARVIAREACLAKGVVGPAPEIAARLQETRLCAEDEARPEP